MVLKVRDGEWTWWQRRTNVKQLTGSDDAERHTRAWESHLRVAYLANLDVFELATFVQMPMS